MHIVNVIAHLRNSDYRVLKVKKEQLSFARYCKSSLHPNPRNKNMEDVGDYGDCPTKLKMKGEGVSLANQRVVT